jgi:pyruvate formate lyase activating enzyme
MNKQSFKSRFTQIVDSEDFITETSSSIYEKIPTHGYDFSGMRYFNNGALYSLNYGKIANLSIIENELHIFLYGNNMRVTFDPYWESSQIGYVSVREYGRDVFINKFMNLGYKFSPEAIVDYALKHRVKKIVFRGGEPAVNADYIVDILKNSKSKDISFILETNGTISEQFFNELQKYESTFRIWLYSSEDEFYIKHTKRSLAYTLDFLRLLNSQNIDFEYLTIMIPGENNSPKRIQNLVNLMLQYNNEPKVNLLKFLPSFRVLDKPADTEQIYDSYVKEFKKYGVKKVVQI